MKGSEYKKRLGMAVVNIMNSRYKRLFNRICHNADTLLEYIESNLLVLLLALWRKISEDPALIDYFSFQLRPNR